MAFPFIPPLDVTLNRVHFLLSDALSPDTGRQLLAVVPQERPAAPPPSCPRFNEESEGWPGLRSRVWAIAPFHLSWPCLPIFHTLPRKYVVLDTRVHLSKRRLGS